MTTDDKKTMCGNLYKEYLDLKKKTHINVEDYIPGKPLNPKHIDPEDLLKKEQIRRQLLDCKDSLDLGANEWFEIENG